MELSRFSDYSLRVLIRCALLKTGQRTSVRALSEEFELSYHHLVKVVHQLAKFGYLGTRRGRDGGIFLLKPAAAIGLGEVIRRTERIELVECHREGECQCVIAPACVLKRALLEAKQAFLAVLDRYTLTDLAEPRSKLQALFV